MGRVGHLIKYLEFQADTTDPQLLSVIKYYSENNGDLSNLMDLTFLDQIEQEFVLDNNGNVRNSMCKVLLMFKIEKAIKAGVLNLEHSYKYLSYEQYLFDKTEWKQNKSELVQKAGLDHLLDIEPILSELKEKLNEQYHTTNGRLESNPHLKVSRDSKVVVRTPPQPESSSEQIISDLLPGQRFYLLQDVLYNINKSVNFTSQFEHYSIKHHKSKPDDNTFLAVIMALGCNIGIKKMGRISKGISSDTLENTKTWYFTPENLNQANNEIIGAINQLDLPKLYLNGQGQVHTSSDGQKFLVKPESLNSNYSFKYFGKDRGVSIYTFIDQRSSIFYSTVINSASRESTFVLDGLLNDSEVHSTMHSTDTHGYTEVIFGIMNLLDIEFAPRIKNLGKQSLYSFEKRAEYEDQGHSILPDFYIKTDIITQNWDDLLRLLASIKLQRCAASEVLSRLNSYSKQNPLYRAIKEFGRIQKSLFILRYYDDVNLRQAIEKQLNLVEMAHRFAKFIFFDNGQEFDVATKEQQDIVAGCKQLIQNSIILWNYLKLTQLYEEMKSEQEQSGLIRAVQNSSIMSWSHINTNGEYVFNEKRAAGGSLDLEKLKGVKIQVANSAVEHSA